MAGFAALGLPWGAGMPSGAVVTAGAVEAARVWVLDDWIEAVGSELQPARTRKDAGTKARTFTVLAALSGGFQYTAAPCISSPKK